MPVFGQAFFFLCLFYCGSLCLKYNPENLFNLRAQRAILWVIWAFCS